LLGSKMSRSDEWEDFELLRQSKAAESPMARPWIKWSVVVMIGAAAVGFSAWRTWVVQQESAAAAARAAAEEAEAQRLALEATEAAELQLQQDGHEMLNRRLDELEACHPSQAQVMNLNLDLERLEGVVEIHLARVEDWPPWIACLNSKPHRLGQWRVSAVNVEEGSPKTVRVQAQFGRAGRP
jgi:hypothetical protein